MAIDGHSDMASINILAHPTFGTLQKGDEKPEDGPGRELEYFRVKWKAGFEHLDPAFTQLYGPQPKVFNLTLPPYDVERVFGSWFQSFGQNKSLKVQCNDTNQVKHWVEGKGYSRELIPCQRGDGDCPLGCKARGYLHIILPDFCAAINRFGFFVVKTGSMTDIEHIAAVLYTSERVYGNASAVGYELTRRLEHFTPIIKGKRARTDSWVLLLQAKHDPAKMLDAPTDAPQLPAPSQDTAISGAYICEDCAEEYTTDDSLILDFVCSHCGGTIGKSVYGQKQIEDSAQYNEELWSQVVDLFQRYMNKPVFDMLNDLEVSAIDFINAHNGWETINAVVIKWLLDTMHPVKVFGWRVQQRRGTSDLMYKLPFGFGHVMMFSREQFRSAGWDVDTEYATGPEDNLTFTNTNGLGDHAFADMFNREFLLVDLELAANGFLRVRAIEEAPAKVADIPF